MEGCQREQHRDDGGGGGSEAVAATAENASSNVYGQIISADALLDKPLIDPPRWGWTGCGGVADVLTPHEVSFQPQLPLVVEFLFLWTGFLCFLWHLLVNGFLVRVIFGTNGPFFL